MDINDEKIRAIARQTLANANNADRFRLSPTPRHVHNGIDSPFAYNPVVSYAGIVTTSNTAATLPTGWKLNFISTGVCDVVHNLGELDQLVWVATAMGAAAGTLPVPVIVPSANFVQFSWFNANNAAAAINTTFYFIGVQVNNKAVAPLQYSVF